MRQVAAIVGEDLHCVEIMLKGVWSPAVLEGTR